MTQLNIKNITKYVVLGLFLVALIPTVSFAKYDDSSDFGYGGWNSSGYSDYSSDYYDTSYGYDVGYSVYDYGYNDYYPSYGGYDYGSYGGYGGNYYTTPSYTGSYAAGANYRPSTSYTTPSYTTPSTSYSSSNPFTTSNANAQNDVKVVTTATGGNANAVASSSNVNVNNNVNNVYVYTNPSGNAVIHNPEYQRLDGYCVITPNNPRVGQSVTATAYMTGGIGSYIYTWGGDLTTSATGVSTTFTSYTAGTKNISVTVRSGQDVITKNCTVTFDNQVLAYNSYNSYSYPSTVTSGTPVSGVFLQPGYVSTGKPVSGVYLNELPATGLDFGFMEYTVGFMVIILATVMVLVSRAKKTFVSSINR